MAEIKQVTPPEASKILDETSEDAVYLDVRTEEEFAAGHPKGAINVPIVFFGESGVTPNADFLTVIEKIIPKKKPILCGCQAGGRSQKAAEVLVGAGYENVCNMQGGFGGTKDATGRVTVTGWKDCGLPVETHASDGVSYHGLKRRAGC